MKNLFKQSLHKDDNIRTKRIIYPTHLTFVYTGSVSCSKPLRASKVMLLHLEEAPSEERVNARFFCAFIWFRAFLGLFLLGRQVLFSLFQDIFNVLDFLQRFNFLLEYSAMIFRYEISLVEGLHNNHQVGLYLRDLHVCVVFCVVLYNIFKFAAQSFLVQFGFKLFFRDHLSNFASLLFNLTHCLNISFDFNTLLGKIGFYLTFNFYVLVSQKFKSFHAKVFSLNWSLGSLLGLGLQSLRFSHCFAFVGILILWLYRKTSVVAIEIVQEDYCCVVLKLQRLKQIIQNSVSERYYRNLSELVISLHTKSDEAICLVSIFGCKMANQIGKRVDQVVEHVNVATYQVLQFVNLVIIESQYEILHLFEGGWEFVSVYCGGVVRIWISKSVCFVSSFRFLCI
ncbi:Hypothetical_protein [Hexamita inflata]|uniref:Hypothetical_protein n=1 Tax=Hexamita inflata TaxID=28002 RepID=A0ABP1JIL6_9EUKA